MMELNDIKNTKGATTLQVRSIEHLQTWLKRDQVLSSELNTKPIDVSISAIQSSPDTWWLSTTPTQT